GGWIKWTDPTDPSKRHDFADGINRPIDVKPAPDGSLWYIERAGIPGGSDAANTATKDGTLWRVRWTGKAGTTTQQAEVAAKLLDGLKLLATAEVPLPATLSATGIFTDKNLTPRRG